VARVLQPLLDAVRHSRAPVPMLVLAGVLEASFLPIPVEVVLLPMMLADRRRVWPFVAAVTVGNVLGGLITYGIAWAVADASGLVESLGWEQAMSEYRAIFQRHGFWAILFVGVSPVPLQVALLVAGAARYPLALFTLAVGIGRGVRYATFGVLVAVLGEKAEALWEKNKLLAGLAMGAVALALWGLSELLRWAFTGG